MWPRVPHDQRPASPCEKINGAWPPVPRDKGTRPPVRVEKS